MTDVNYGPLAALIGTWEGDNGMDVAPEPDGTEHNPYYETITFEAGGDVYNAEKQHLAVVPYKQVVKRKSDNVVFHHQMGYWLYDMDAGTVMQSITIPRGVCVLAGGTASTDSDGKTVLQVSANAGAADWGVLQSPFMESNAKTTGFSHKLTVDGDELAYGETTKLDIYGKAFDHTDGNTLKRIR